MGIIHSRGSATEVGMTLEDFDLEGLEDWYESAFSILVVLEGTVLGLIGSAYWHWRLEQINEWRKGG